MWIPFMLWWCCYLGLNRWSSPEVRENFKGTIRTWQDSKGGWAWYKRHFILIMLGLSFFWRVIFAFGYSYEAQIYMEAVLPTMFAWPFFRKLFTHIRVLAVCIMPILVFVIIEQIKAVQFEQWTYCTDCGYKFIVWGRQSGSLLERSLYFGVDMPLIEILFYPAYILLTVAIAAIAIESLPKSWRLPSNNWMRKVFPIVFGSFGTVMGIGVIMFFIKNGSRTIPYHTIAAFVPFALLWTGTWFSNQVKKLVTTPLFVFGTAFSFIWTAVWEWLHASLQMHWIYLTQNSMGSIDPIIDSIFQFPDLPLLGGVPLAWPIEEWAAYPTLYVFMAAYILFFDDVMKLGLLKHPIVLDINDIDIKTAGEEETGIGYFQRVPSESKIT